MTKPTLTLLALLAAAPAAADCRATASGPVAVVELYTSEGCSSCPPADRWLSTLGRTPAPLPVVPLALHVPYWDYIGWKDPYASPRHEERQRLAARRSHGSFVYTPQVLVNGQDFRGWIGERFDEALRELAARPGEARLTLSARPGPREVEIHLDGQGPAGARALLFRTESGLESEIRAGENAGRRLTHDHVVRQWAELGAADADGRIALRHSLPADPRIRAGRSRLVAILEDPASGRVLQAVALACPE